MIHAMTEAKTLDSPVDSRSLESSAQRWEGHMSDDIAATYGPEPLAFLRATPDEIVISGTRGTYSLPRTSVTKIGRGKMYPWFFTGVRIVHSVGSYPKNLQFKPLGGPWQEILQALRQQGYPTA